MAYAASKVKIFIPSCLRTNEKRAWEGLQKKSILFVITVYLACVAGINAGGTGGKAKNARELRRGRKAFLSPLPAPSIPAFALHFTHPCFLFYACYVG